MWNGYNFQVVDTGGIVFDDTVDIFASKYLNMISCYYHFIRCYRSSPWLEKINDQSLYALNEAQAAVMVCDGLEGVNPLDEALAQFLRKHNKTPLYLAVNKCESETRGVLQAQDFWSLGLGQPYPVSGIHGTGLGKANE